MSPAGPHGAPAAWENRSLFSEHFLLERLPDLAPWGDDAGAAWARARALWAEARGRLAGMGEAQTEERWIRPVLAEVLGWAYGVQAPVPSVTGRTNRPDYALFASAPARDAAEADRARLWTHAVAVADAKAWERSLDAAGAGGGLTHANPSFQIVAYLFLTGVEWAVLTNGREWRLYAARARSRVDTYFAVDLARILETDDEAAFRYFLRFFGAASFAPDARLGGATFLDAVLRQSAEYGAALEGRLRDLVFSSVFRDLARGFVHDHRRRTGRAVLSEAELQAVFEGTLRLLYRLLFLLHAEARELLPVRDTAGYHAYSLTRIRRTVAEKVLSGQKLSARARDLWNDLRSLFDIVDQGDPALGVPHYDGGLFRADEPRNAFLAEHEVSDLHLVPALDRLSRDEQGHFLDYKSLDVEQLGSLYEGLLEYRLRLDAHDDPYLENDRGERHATGSYYTPHPVVEYIVAETVGPVLAARADAFRAAMAADGADAELRRRRAAEHLLSLRIVDPAMGSGHFLVHAANWLTERLIALLSEFPENPVLARLDAIRHEIVARLAADGITIRPEQLRDTALLKRMVIKRCIYGVDLNPMAAELAKLSLWLDSFTVGAPLSFLDHHLKCGNSLAGTRVVDVIAAMEASPTGQLDTFGGPFASVLRAAELMRGVSMRSDASFEEVAESARLHAEFEGVMAPYKRLLDLWVSRGFGNRRAEEVATLLPDEVMAAARGGRARLNREQAGALAQAVELAAAQRFFHWDLEFPEVFVDLERASWKEDPGFDAVIGNPPYVRQEQVKGLKPFLAGAYADVHDGAADLYVYFYRLGLELLRPGGRMSYIVTNKWLRAGYGEKLRGWMAANARVERIVDFGHAPIFAEADVFPVIVVLERPEPGTRPDAGEAQVTQFPREALGGSLAPYIEANVYTVSRSRFGAQPWSLERPEVDRLMHRIREGAVLLRDYVSARPLYGVKTGFNEAFLVDTATRDRLVAEDPNSAEVLRPYLRGQDVERWSPNWAGLWMIFARRGIEIERYPAILRHLSAFRTELEPKPANWSGDRWEGRKAGSYAWYELQDTVDYFEAFERPKIIWKDLSFFSEFCLDANGLFCNNLCYILPTEDRWLLTVLNSPVVWSYLSRAVVHGKDEVLRLHSIYMEHLPIAPQPRGSEGEVETTVGRLIEITNELRTIRGEMAFWLRSTLGIEKPGQKLERFDDLNAEDFVAEVRARRPRKADPLKPRDLSVLRSVHAEAVPKLVSLAAQASGLEGRLARLVNRAYGLSAAEVELMWRTAPPRMPPGR